ncbi:MAG: hypothetical protein K6U74_17475 [Firmicutes bacterium]|nr:hypothetical protein [Bacillota bacterium]
MPQEPDIAGFPLEEAFKRLEALGWGYEVVVTRPVKGNAGGEPRVVRFNRLSKDKGVLTVVFEDKGKGGGKGGL